MRVVFLGSPEFAVPSLRALAAAFEVVGVITRPDRPAGRGRSLRSPPVSQVAVELGLPRLQPDRASQPDALQAVRGWRPDIIVVAAYGDLLPAAYLDMSRLGCVNVHASLLPRWRGASPIQAAILHGDHETGVTFMRMDEGLDTGPILSQARTPIAPTETAGDLALRLAHLGADGLAPVLDRYASGELAPQAQPETGVTVAPRLRKDSGWLDFAKPAALLERQVRAFEPWPSSFFLWKGQRIVVRQARAVPLRQGRPGQVTQWEGRPAIATGESGLVLESIQPAGKRRMAGEDFAIGARGFIGSDLPIVRPAGPAPSGG